MNGNILIRYTPNPGAYRVEHDFSNSHSILETLSFSLQEVAEKEKTLFSKALYEIINPDGLRTLFEPTPSSPRKSGNVSFTLEGYRITINAGESITYPTIRIASESGNYSPSNHSIRLRTHREQRLKEYQ